MIAFPNAKINLGLNIINKRSDGYHNIETVFYPIPLHDVLEVVYAPVGTSDYTWHNSGLAIDAPAHENIVIKALNLVKKSHQLSPIAIQLHKVIPFGAGLGGGSADAAAMIQLLDQFFELGMTLEEQKRLAAQLGADCSFFIENKPSFATGIGDQLTPVSLSLTGYYLVLVKPNIHVSTPEAYSGVTPRTPTVGIFEIIKRPVAEWREQLTNDFETSVFKKHPKIATIKQQLYNYGAIYASMSGSGSSVFGLFEEPIEIDLDNCFVWQGRL